MILGKKLYSKTNRVFNFLKTFKMVFSSFLKIVSRDSKKSLGSEGFIQGAPALTIKEDGELRCTSCLLCEQLCPSHCIVIETDETLEEAAPQNFDISILRCTFCGICAEVCPVDAIRMAGPMPSAGHSEQNWIWDKEYLKTYAGVLKSEVGEDRPLLPY